VLAVSGGADSVALVRAWQEIRGNAGDEWAIATFDHGLRAESAADASFVEALAKKQNVPFFVGRPAVAIEAGKEHSVEAAARNARYAFLKDAARDYQAQAVLTAHTADDQIETLLFRMVRGTGLAGLAGIPRRRKLIDGVDLLRPMLAVRRREVEGYLAELGQPFVSDPSNDDVRFVRNRIRHVLLPLIRQEIHAGVDDALLRLAETAREEWRVEEEKTRRACQEVVIREDEQECLIGAESLLRLGERRAGRVLREMVSRLGGSLCGVGWKSVRRALLVGQTDGPRRAEWAGGTVFEKHRGGLIRVYRDAVKRLGPKGSSSLSSEAE
jgi:tRNA(Ile)-lysidine synthase